MKFQKTVLFMISLAAFGVVSVNAEDVCRLESPDGHNVIRVFINGSGQPLYRVERRGLTLISDSPLGLRCDDQDFSRQMTLHEKGPKTSHQETYQLFSGNTLHVNTNLNQTWLILKNSRGSLLTIELAASNEGVGFRYRFAGSDAARVVVDEATGFQIPPSAAGWLQPYHAAGKYTPAYEDFYFKVSPGDLPPVSREKPRGWCLPALFQVPAAQSWMLITESGTDGAYCACHLANESSSKGLYKIALAFEDEVTAAKSFHADAKPAPVTTRATPWRVIILGNEAKDILSSTLVTDLAPPSQIDDTSWIEPGRASWPWWSHPEDKNTDALYNQFTDLAAEFGWEYTLFDAGWWNADLDAICRYAHNKAVKPLIWTQAMDFYDANKRNRKLDDWTSKGIKGIKVDFWCSDRQDKMAAIHATLQDAAKRKLLVSLHGCTIPRGWHRTWPNLLTAEAVLGTECYFYEERYPSNAAEFNTILPFTRNVMAPMDITPVALTIRKYPRKITAVHELATAIIFNTGIIHYADSVEVFQSLPNEVRQVLKTIPAAWDETVCLVGEPGQKIILARRTGQYWIIAGLNGTNQSMPISLDLESFGKWAEMIEITEGENPLVNFQIKEKKNISPWQHNISPWGGFVLSIRSAK